MQNDPTALSPADRIAEVAAKQAQASGAAKAATQAASQTTGPQAQPPASSQDLLSEAHDWAVALFEQLMRPWVAYQVLIAVALLLLADVLSRLLRPRLRDWLRNRESWPKWRYRFMISIERRLRLLLFVVMIWPAVWVMRELTWPSRSYLLSKLGTLALAWLIIATVTRQISNRLLRQIVRYTGWAWATLAILDLADDTRRLLESITVSLGTLTLSLWTLLQAIFILGILFVGARLLSRGLAASIKSNPDLSPSMQVLTTKLVQLALYTAAIAIGLKVLGIDLTGLAVLSGAIGVGIGFGLQKVVSNLVSGMIILLDKSIKPGDVISLGDTFGWVDTLGARYASIVTRDGREYLIPNEDLVTSQVVNWSHTNTLVRLEIRFGTSYGDDPHKVRELAISAAAGVSRVLKSPPPVCHIVGFGDSSVDYTLRFWISDPTAGLTNVRGDVFLAVWDAFHAAGVRIPFPQREVRLLEGSEIDAHVTPAGTAPPGAGAGN